MKEKNIRDSVHQRIERPNKRGKVKVVWTCAKEKESRSREKNARDGPVST